MKRSVGAVLILLYWLGPLVAALPANAESRLPACCRRNGAHHCAMMGATMLPGAGPVVAPPAHCSSFPTGEAAMIGPHYWLGPHLLRLPAEVVRPHSAAMRREYSRQGQFRNPIPRAPPASSPA